MQQKIVICASALIAAERENSTADSACIYEETDSNIKLLKEDCCKEISIIGFIPDECLQEKLFELLTSDGKLTVERAIPTRELGQELTLNLKIAGFVQVMAIKDMNGERLVVSQKPKYDFQSTATVTLPAPVVSSKAVVSLDDDLIDEDDLLLNENPSVTANSKPGEGCGIPTGIPGKKRACKNCSCGLAEVEKGEAGASVVVLTNDDDKIAKSSSCGGCSRGDAFRCASCPFLGKPAFEPGQERLVLNMTDDLEFA